MGSTPSVSRRKLKRDHRTRPMKLVHTTLKVSPSSNYEDDPSDKYNESTECDITIQCNTNSELSRIKYEIKGLLHTKVRNIKTDKKIFAAISNFCRDRESNQKALNGSIKGIMKLIGSSFAVIESLQVIVSLCQWHYNYEDSIKYCPDKNPLSDHYYNANNIEELGASSACEIVVSILKQSGDRNDEVAELGCLAIFYLALIEENRQKLNKRWAYDVVSDMLNLYSEKSEVVVEAAYWAIHRLAFHHNVISNNSKLCAWSKVEYVVETLKLHGKTSIPVAIAGCYAINSLATDDEITSEELGQYGACEIVLEILKVLGMTNMSVAEAGCLAICSLAQNENNCDRLGLCKVLKEILLKYGQISANIKKCEDIIQSLQ